MKKTRVKYSRMVPLVVGLQNILGLSVFSKLPTMSIYKFYNFKDF